MALSVETAKREMSGALIDIFKLRAAPLLARVEACTSLPELRHLIFSILEDTRSAEPDRARQLRLAWEALGEP